MHFFYHKDAGCKEIYLDSQQYHYLFHVRRFKVGQTITIRNLIDSNKYVYQHKHKEYFFLISLQQDKQTISANECHIILAYIDIKDIYDILPYLNVLNIASLNLFYADFSQKNRKIDKQKAQKILHYSCMQCGRTNLMQITYFSNLQEVLQIFNKACVIDFNNYDTTTLSSRESNNHANITEENQQNLSIQTNQTFESLDTKTLRYHAKNGIILGAEGGFSERERKQILINQQRYSLKIPHILTSHAVSIYIASLCAGLNNMV